MHKYISRETQLDITPQTGVVPGSPNDHAQDFLASQGVHANTFLGDKMTSHAAAVAAVESSQSVTGATQVLLDSVSDILTQQRSELGKVGGNVRIDLLGRGSFVIVTREPNIGIFPSSFGTPVHFSLSCKEWFFDFILHANLDSDFEAAAQEAALEIDGDVDVFHRLFALKRHKTPFEWKLRAAV